MEKNDVTYINNRKAYHNYYIEDKFTAGIQLEGSEVKSIRKGHVNISEAFIYAEDNELFLKNALVSNINVEKMFGHSETRDRKLLLKKTEIKRILKAISIKGYSCVPLTIIVPKNGYIKLEIATAKGKHEYDKRNAIKERDLDREANH